MTATNPFAVSRKPPIILGEVLFDEFPDGKKVLGGAPFNIAWNLHGLGVPNRFFSAVGDDSQGRQIVESMEHWGMEVDDIQTCLEPTGRVLVTLEAGLPSYEIVHPSAFDSMGVPDQGWDEQDHSLLYLGSLALRDSRSRATMENLIASTSLPRMVDLNIRDPWFEMDWLELLLGDARWVKMNDEELERVSQSRLPPDKPEMFRDAALRVMETYRIEAMFITLGARGVYFAHADQWRHVDAVPPNQLVDTVGAGDAFVSGLIAGMMTSSSATRILGDAVRFASRVCQLDGATTTDRTFYTLTP